MNRLLIAAVVLPCLLACSGAEQATETPVPPTSTVTPIPATATPMSQTLTDIAYSGSALLDVYLPDGEERPWPTVLVLHALGGTKEHYIWVAKRLSESGYAVVVPTWNPLRISTENAFCALAWLHANAEGYSFDPQRVAAFGHSNGGTLAVLLAAIDDPTEFLQECAYALPPSGAVQGAISYAGSFMMPEWYLTQGRDQLALAMEQYLEIPGSAAREILQTMLDTPFEHWLEIAHFDDKGTHFIHSSPPAWIDGSEPPMLLIHGTNDNTVNPLESEAFAALLEVEGVKVQLLIISSARHGLGQNEPGFDEAWNATQAFLAQLFK